VSAADYLRRGREEIDATLDRLLPRPAGPATRLAEAMRYAVLGGGKRLRPVLAIACCEACGGSRADALEPAAAIELLHTYSLVHDDLPSMDDDDLRRGRPTLHRAFGEALAVLAGDALHTLTFEVAARHPPGDRHAAARLRVVACLARAAGIEGMVGGQIADLEHEGRPVDPDSLRWIHRHKTGALFAASAEIGAIVAGAEGATLTAVREFGEALGLAFQIADDVLDRTATSSALGKTAGKDERAGKATFPARFGVEASRAEASALVADARARLAPLGLLSDDLAGIADRLVHRSS
jgi:geranylgeranyl diphosphate synthase type II